MPCGHLVNTLMSKINEVAVIGAGIAGLTIAYYLVKNGYNVTVYDRENYAGMQCSYANGGQLSVSNSETWHSWSNVYKGLQWLTKKDAPLLIRPMLDMDQVKWLVRFLYNTATGIREQNTIETIKLGLESRVLYNEIIKDEKIKFDCHQSGIMHFYTNQNYFESAKTVSSLYENNGCQFSILTAKEVFDIEPTLRNNRAIIGGAYTKHDSVGDIHKFCNGMINVLQTKYQVSFRSGPAADVQYIDRLTEIYDRVVIANGAESTVFSKQLGDRNTIYPVKGYSITINNPGVGCPNTSLLDDQAKIVASRLGNRLRVAGTAELCGYNYDITRSRIEPLLTWVKTNFPEINTREYTPWACLRPMTSDMMPMVIKSKRKNVYYHTGHGHLGWTVAPATAKKLFNIIHND